MENNHAIEGMMGITMEKIKQMVDVNTIIGEPINSPDGTVIIPVSKVTYGFASGGSDLPSKKVDGKELFGGGSGAGITISPVAFLTIHDGDIKLMQIETYLGAIDRVIGMTPELIDKVTGLFKKSKKKVDKVEEKSCIKIEDPEI